MEWLQSFEEEFIAPSKTRKRMKLLLVFLVILGLIWWRVQNRVTVVNATSQTIRYLVVDERQFENVPPGRSVSFGFHIEHDHIFDVQAILEDGRELKDICGYLVWEDDWRGAVRCRITIEPSGEMRFEE
jgi:hypothetical protein